MFRFSLECCELHKKAIIKKHLLFKSLIVDKILTEYKKTRHYISLMDVTWNLIFITLYYIYSKLLMISIFKIMMLIESGILLKSHVSCNLC